MHRRDILKLFSVGAVVAPVIDGVPAPAAARIVAPAAVELVERYPVSKPQLAAGIRAVLYFPDGAQYRFAVGSVDLSVRDSLRDCSSLTGFEEHTFLYRRHHVTLEAIGDIQIVPSLFVVPEALKA